MHPERAASPVVKRTIRVAVPVDKAFQIFADRMGSWWPATHHVGADPFKDIIVEQRTGGRWFEINSKGEECVWGTVLVWEPPRELVLSWHLQPDWKVDLDPAKSSEVALEFFAEGATATRIEFEHRHLERHGGDHLKLFAGVDSPGGWTAVLGSYEALVKVS